MAGVRDAVDGHVVDIESLILKEHPLVRCLLHVVQDLVAIDEVLHQRLLHHCLQTMDFIGNVQSANSH